MDLFTETDQRLANLATRMMLSKNNVAKIVYKLKKCGNTGCVQKRKCRPCKLTRRPLRYIGRLVEINPRKLDFTNEVKIYNAP